jgi:DNA-binding transcriptional MerR regulator
MSGPYRTSDVERLLGVGEHVLRYWEHALPLLSPLRSQSGRRAWSEADLALLLRVRHLVRERGLSLEATLQELIEERTGSGVEIAAILGEARSDLIRTWFEARALADRLARRVK